jgi:2-polyprenyl-6-methoxyphenol hydroxylase-like FAD-dependent oxidoreductase
VFTRFGKQALVIGAGIAGLAAARALADFFDYVIILENDAVSKPAAHRPGTPQSRHLHGLLPGGQQALSYLFPDFENALSETGAVRRGIGYDYHIERPGYDPFPLRDFGIHVYSVTRPVLEQTVRECLLAFRNVELRECCHAQAFIAASGEPAVSAVRCETSAGATEIIPADLVVDASGHGRLTLTFLESLGFPLPEEASIGLIYATALFDIPQNASPDWMGIITHPQYPHHKRAALLLPVEGRRWILTLAGRYDHKPPSDWGGYLTYAQNLRTQTIFNAIRRCKPIAEIARFGLKSSRWRHFEDLQTFPCGLLATGDAICRFNPIYGQGMSVAAMEAVILHRLLSQQRPQGERLPNLSAAFFAETAQLIDTPWWIAAVPDFIDPRTDGQRPADLMDTLRSLSALLKIAAEDPAIHQLFIEMQSLLKPRSALRTAELIERMEATSAAPKRRTIPCPN